MRKRILTVTLAMLMGLSAFGACSNTQHQQTTAEPTPTEKTKPKQFFKVLTLGHSLTVDSNHMLALVAKAEGYEGLQVGTLYDSGCPLHKHVQYLQNDSKAYSLYYSTTDDVSGPPTIMDNVSMLEALRYKDWDLIVMQGGTFTLTESQTYTNGNIQIIQDYVNQNKLNPDAPFVWHMPWAFATEETLQAMYPKKDNNHYTKGYQPFDNDRLKLYAVLTGKVKEHIVPDETFLFVIPTGTAMENAMSSYLTEFDLLRDYAHATDYGRLIAAYTWYCCLTGTEYLENIKMTTIPKQFFRSTVADEDRVLTDMEKAILIESVNNALKNPLELTQSQYTQAPA